MQVFAFNSEQLVIIYVPSAFNLAEFKNTYFMKTWTVYQ